MCKYKESVLVQLCMQEPYIPIGADLHEDYTCNILYKMRAWEQG